MLVDVDRSAAEHTMEGVVIGVDQVLQHVYIGVCVRVCEIPPHFTLQGRN